MGLFLGVLVGAGITLAGSIASLAGLIISNHSTGPGVTNSTVTGGISSHQAVFDMSGPGSGFMFLELFAVVCSLVLGLYSCFHGCRWANHCRGAHRAWREHDEEQRWQEIESHFLERFQNQAGNGHPAVEMIQEDGDVGECPDESCEQPTVTEPSAPLPDPVTERCHQSTQVYTCDRGTKSVCRASSVKGVKEVESD